LDLLEPCRRARRLPRVRRVEGQARASPRHSTEACRRPRRMNKRPRQSETSMTPRYQRSCAISTLLGLGLPLSFGAAAAAQAQGPAPSTPAAAEAEPQAPPAPQLEAIPFEEELATFVKPGA